MLTYSEDAGSCSATRSSHPNFVLKTGDLPVKYEDTIPVKTVVKESCYVLIPALVVEVGRSLVLSSRYSVDA